MALMIRKTDQQTFVHGADGAFAPEGARKGPDSNWFVAQGQPDTCTRFTVHGLSADEILRCDHSNLPEILKEDQGTAAERVASIGAFTAELIEQNLLACKLGLVAIDGKAVSESDLADFTPAAQASIAQLIRGASTNPLTFRA